MKSLNAALQQLFKDAGLEEPLKRHTVMKDWSTIVGERIAGVTTPHRVANGVLFVRVKSDAWRHELMFHKPQILKAIAERENQAPIRDIVWL